MASAAARAVLRASEGAAAAGSLGCAGLEGVISRSPRFAPQGLHVGARVGRQRVRARRIRALRGARRVHGGGRIVAAAAAARVGHRRLLGDRHHGQRAGVLPGGRLPAGVAAAADAVGRAAADAGGGGGAVDLLRAALSLRPRADRAVPDLALRRVEPDQLRAAAAAAARGGRRGEVPRGAVGAGAQQLVVPAGGRPRAVLPAERAADHRRDDRADRPQPKVPRRRPRVPRVQHAARHAGGREGARGAPEPQVAGGALGRRVQGTDLAVEGGESQPGDPQFGAGGARRNLRRRPLARRVRADAAGREAARHQL